MLSYTAQNSLSEMSYYSLSVPVVSITGKSILINVIVRIYKMAERVGGMCVD